MTVNALDRAERHVRDAERCVARLVIIIDELDRDRHPRAAAMAREVLATLEQSFELARYGLERERGLEPQAWHGHFD